MAGDARKDIGDCLECGVALPDGRGVCLPCVESGRDLLDDNARTLVSRALLEGYVQGARDVIDAVRKSRRPLEETLGWLESPDGLAALNPKTKDF